MRKRCTGCGRPNLSDRVRCPACIAHTRHQLAAIQRRCQRLGRPA